jgi:hypothetical protein
MVMTLAILGQWYTSGSIVAALGLLWVWAPNNGLGQIKESSIKYIKHLLKFG